jgi:demethylmenaquinone methyltransferase/2-methoxy-6-polyprenyl-1,4-benzoquinol methylase
VGPAGHITGLDLSSEHLVHARDIVKQAGLAERISLREGNVRELPFDDDVFDWAWSVDLVGYAPMEPLPLVRELARVVKPGGSVATGIFEITAKWDKTVRDSYELYRQEYD